ncbi:hypothetical protein [Bdellovibrio reynosensis]|uniref:Lipoprotein n=1 Tax=Bdellovibrio reynosensis TaxID=2835041 RepID=A0ABY4CD32_9BACT|nr:hypothetical protein [Bdellovibrio reynosensis]UOF01438.1 hypothetical protein MNR06_00535 [Bdellovibrio reynosensis]
MRPILILLTLFFSICLTGGCSFSKDSKRIESKVLATSYTAEFDLINSSTEELLNFLEDQNDLSLFKVQIRGKDSNLTDLAAERKDLVLLRYLQSKGFSPFEYSLETSVQFLSGPQKEIIDELQKKTSSDIEYALAYNKITKASQRGCKAIIDKLMQERWTESEESSVTKIITFLNSPVCRETLQSITEQERNQILSTEFMFQFKHDFFNFPLFSALALNAQVENFKIKSIDPLIFLKWKARCISRSEFNIWESFFKQILRREFKSIPTRYKTTEECAHEIGLTYAGALDEVDEHCKNENKIIGATVMSEMGLKEEDLKCIK